MWPEEGQFGQNVITPCFVTMTAGVGLYSECKTWIDAWEYCFSQDTRLVHLTEVKVEAAVARLLYAKTPSWLDVWIGLEWSIFDCSTTWVWMGGGDHRWTPTLPGGKTTSSTDTVARSLTTRNLRIHPLSFRSIQMSGRRLPWGATFYLPKYLNKVIQYTSKINDEFWFLK